jgi:hypothetical protein
VQHSRPFCFTEKNILNVIFELSNLSRIKYDYWKDGSLEMRLYLIGAGPEDTGQYECSIPGLDIEAALITLYITQGKKISKLNHVYPT